MIQLFDSLTFSGKPSQLWFGEASLKDKNGSAVTLPIVEFYELEGGETPQTFEHSAFMCRTTYRVEVWAQTLETCTDVVLGMLFNGGTLSAGAGFYSGGTLSFAANSYVFKAIEYLPTTPFPAHFEGKIDPRDESANRVYKGTFFLRVSAEWVGS